MAAGSRHRAPLVHPVASRKALQRPCVASHDFTILRRPVYLTPGRFSVQTNNGVAVEICRADSATDLSRDAEAGISRNCSG